MLLPNVLGDAADGHRLYLVAQFIVALVIQVGFLKEMDSWFSHAEGTAQRCQDGSFEDDEGL